MFFIVSFKFKVHSDCGGKLCNRTWSPLHQDGFFYFMHSIKILNRTKNKQIEKARSKASNLGLCFAVRHRFKASPLHLLFISTVYLILYEFAF